RERRDRERERGREGDRERKRDRWREERQREREGEGGRERDDGTYPDHTHSTMQCNPANTGQSYTSGVSMLDSNDILHITVRWTQISGKRSQDVSHLLCE